MSNEAERGEAGPFFEEFLREQGSYEEAMARRLRTSRSQLDRLLDPDNDSVSLATLARAAQALGRTLELELQ